MNQSIRPVEAQLPLVTFTEKKQERFENNRYAPLEPKTKRILQKLKKRLEQIDEKITADSLENSRSKIKHLINRKVAQRVSIDREKLPFFSEGKNAAKMSRRVEGLRERLRQGFLQGAQKESLDKNLKGRITKSS